MTQAAAPAGRLAGFARRHPAILAGCLAAGMMLAAYILLGIWPFGDGTVLTGDLNAQYIPYYAHYRRAVFEGAGFFYGFDKSLGGGLLGLFAYYVASPLNLLYLAVPATWFPPVAAFILLVKVTLATAFMALFLYKKFPSLSLLGLVPALGYGFSAFVFVYAQNVMWHDVLVLLPLVCLGLERLMDGKSPLPYAGLLGLMVLANFYIAYMACLFLVLYFIASMVLRRQGGKPLLRQSLRFAGASVLGGGLSAALLLPALYNLSGSKGELFSLAFSLKPQFPLWQLPEKLAFNSFLWPDVVNGRPLLYCGLALPLLALCFFISRKVGMREKLCAGAVLAVLVLSFWLTGLDTLWHGLKAPIWFPYRYSWLFCFTLAGVAAAALAKGAAGKKELMISGGALAAVFLALAPFSETVGAPKLLASAAGVLGFAVLFLAVGNLGAPARKRLAGLALLALVCAELTLNAVLVSRKFEPYTLSNYQQFVRQVGGAMETASEENQRAEKNFYRTLNDPMLLGYRGLSHFGSTQDNPATDTLWNLGYRGNGSYLYGSTAFADSVLGLSRLLTGEERPLPAHWQPWQQTEAGPVYENPDALPMFFTASLAPQPEESPALQADSFAYQNALYRLLSGEAEDILLPAEAVLRDEAGAALPGPAGTLPPGAEYTIEAKADGYYYALPVAANPLYDLETFIDGQPAGRCFTADQNGVINLGQRKAGESIRLSWGQTEPIEINEMYFAVLPPEKLAALAQTARENSGTFTLADGKVTGSITARAGRQALFTSIPYSADWRAWVNGKEAEPFPVAGGLLALPLAAGENEIRMEYRPSGAVWGQRISTFSFSMFCCLAAVGLMRRKFLPGAGAGPKTETEETERTNGDCDYSGGRGKP